MFGTERAEEKCGKNSVKMMRCEITESDVDHGNRVCSLKCRCADSAKSCQVQVYSSVHQVNMEIFELKVNNQNSTSEPKV